MLAFRPARVLSGIALVGAVCVPLLFSSASGAASRPKILLFTETAGFDHKTRGIADSLIIALGAKNGFDVDTANDTGAYFHDAKLKSYRAIYFSNVTGLIFNDSCKAAIKRYIEAGGSWLGNHAGGPDCEQSWPWFHQMIGCYFVGHPDGIKKAKIAVLDHTNPSTSWIKTDTIVRSDEWYFFAPQPSPQKYDSNIDPAKLPNVKVLMNLVESSFDSTRNRYHPICWCQEFPGGGRMWYSGFGHYVSYYRDTVVQKVLLGGILWAAHLSETPTAPENPKAAFTIAPASGESAVYDLFGRKIRTLHDDGASWDRTDDCGKPVAPGRYYLVRKQKGAISPLRSVLLVK